MRENPTVGKKNVSNVAYDITTLQYMQSLEGEKQKYADDMGKHSYVSSVSETYLPASQYQLDIVLHFEATS